MEYIGDCIFLTPLGVFGIRDIYDQINRIQDIREKSNEI